MMIMMVGRDTTGIYGCEDESKIKMYSSKKISFSLTAVKQRARKKRENYEAMKIYYHPNLIVRSLTTTKKWS